MAPAECLLVSEDSHHLAMEINLKLSNSKHIKKADFYNLYMQICNVDWGKLESYTDINKQYKYNPDKKWQKQ